MLVLAPLAHGDSIVFATDRVQTPTHVVQIGIDGHGARVIAAVPILDRSAAGALATTDAAQKTLLVDGRPAAHVDWPIDEARFSPDGSEIAFTAQSLASVSQGCETYCASWELWLVGRDGSGLRELSRDGRLPRFSPDGRQLAFLQGPRGESEGGWVIVLQLATGTTTRFGFAEGAPPAWSPRSDRIAYSSSPRGSVFVATLAPHRVTPVARGSSPLFSPDGKALAYARPGGLAVQQLASGRAVAVAPVHTSIFVWCSSGWLVYAAQVSSYPPNTQLFRVRPNGTHRALLRGYEPTATFDWLRARGTTLTFQVTRTRYSLATIDAVDLASGEVRQLTHDGGADESPSVAPNGALAYARGSAARFGWYCLAAGGRCLRTAQTPEGIQEPAWSPDGRRIALLEHTKAGTGIDLTVVDAATGAGRVVHHFGNFAVKPSTSSNGTATRIVVGGVYDSLAGGLSWSPGGRTIVVGSNVPNSEHDLHIHLWLVDVATGAATELSTGDFGSLPSWSPDGTTIAFVGGTWGGPQEAELYDVATGTVTPLVANTGPDSRMAWSPDSSQLAYQAADGSLHVVDRDGTADRQIVAWALPGSAIAWQR